MFPTRCFKLSVSLNRVKSKVYYQDITSFPITIQSRTVYHMAKMMKSQVTVPFHNITTLPPLSLSSSSSSSSSVAAMINSVQLNRTVVTKRDLIKEEEIMGKPFTLPPGEFKPKQSLGQNFLSDQNYVRKIVDCLREDDVDEKNSSSSNQGNRVIEIGPGLGALTRLLQPKYPNMRAIEIDQRSIEFLKEKIPKLEVLHMNALDADWSQLAADRQGRLHVIGNLPYYIVSQILFSLVDHYKAIYQGIFTMQLEVAERLVAKPGTKQYGIPSVVFQLYSKPILQFKIPPTVFYPVPKVDSALVTLDFSSPHPALQRVKLVYFRRVVTAAFNQRRKMLRQSLKDVVADANSTLSDKWATKRPDQLTPLDFIELTLDIFGEKKTEVEVKTKINSNNNNTSNNVTTESISLSKETQLVPKLLTRDYFASEIVWRRSVNVKKDSEIIMNDDIDLLNTL